MNAAGNAQRKLRVSAAITRPTQIDTEIDVMKCTYANEPECLRIRQTRTGCRKKNQLDVNSTDRIASGNKNQTHAVSPMPNASGENASGDMRIAPLSTQNDSTQPHRIGFHHQSINDSLG